MRTILLPHNKTAYQKVMQAFETADRTCVVHPTGTGKSYLIAAVSESFKRVLILGPNTFVLDQVHSVLAWRDKATDAGTVEYMTYTLLMYKEQIPTGYDLICLDEFHRAGAPEWGDAVDRLLEANPQAKVLGTTATPIRFLDDNRDMADELFGGNIASYMTLKDAWDRDILATPRFVTGLFEFDKVTADIEERISKSQRIDAKEKKVRLTRVNNLRLDWERSQGMPQIIRKHIDKDARRIIVFCGNIEKLKEMEQTVCGWFQKAGIRVASVYQMHAYMPDNELKSAMDGFESDDFGEGGVKLMMSVNMLNEGVHIPRVNAVILLRTTSSKIIYLQQIGRCLTAEKKDKPIILDMVDNITTTNIVHDIKEGFDWYEHQQLKDDDEHEPSQPKDFVVYDYTLGIRQAIEKLVPGGYSRPYEELLAIVTEFCEKNGRAPSRNEYDVHLVWANLVSHHKDKPGFKALYEKYSKSKRMTFENRVAQLKAFVEKNDRLPIMKDGDDEWNNLQQLRRINKEKNYAELTAIFDKYNLVRTDEQLKQVIIDFFNEHGRLPRKSLSNKEAALYKTFMLRKSIHDDPEISRLLDTRKKQRGTEERILAMIDFTSKHGRRPNTKNENKMYALWTRMLARDMNDPRVKEMAEKYGPKEKDLKEYMAPLIDFLRENHRRPSTTTTEYEKHLYSIIANLRKNYPDHPDVKPLLAEIDALPSPGEQKQTRNDEWVRREIVRFTDLYHRLPKTKGGDKAETTLARLWASRRDRLCQDDPQMQAILDQYDRRPMKFKERYALVRDWAAVQGRLPSKTDGDIFQAYDTLRRSYYNVPEVKDLLNKYGRRPAKPKTDIDARLDQIEAFANEHGRLPSTAHSDELQLARRWHNIKRRYGLLDRVVALVERFPIQNKK